MVQEYVRHGVLSILLATICLTSSPFLVAGSPPTQPAISSNTTAVNAEQIDAKIAELEQRKKALLAKARYEEVEQERIIFFDFVGYKRAVLLQQRYEAEAAAIDKEIAVLKAQKK